MEGRGFGSAALRRVLCRARVGGGHAGLKARTLAAPQPSRQARKAAKAAGFVEVSAAQWLSPTPASSLVLE